MSKRRTEISIEMREITIIRTNGKRQSGFCQSCRRVVPVFSPETLASFLQVSVSEICRLVEIERLHLTDAERGVALICGSSLLASGQMTLPEE